MDEFSGIIITLLVVAGPILLAAVIIFFVMRGQARRAEAAQKRAAELEARMARAVWAGATVVNIRNNPHLSTLERGSRVKVDLRLEVQSPGGGTPYQATTSWLVDSHALGQVQPGQSLSVKVDVEDSSKIYPNVSWARPWMWD